MKGGQSRTPAPTVCKQPWDFDNRRDGRPRPSAKGEIMAELQDKIAAVAQQALDSKNGQNISAIHVAKQTVLTLFMK